MVGEAAGGTRRLPEAVLEEADVVVVVVEEEESLALETS